MNLKTFQSKPGRVTETISEIITTAFSSTLSVGSVDRVSHQCNIDVNTPAAVIFTSATEIDADDELFTQVDHGLTTGLKGQFTTSDTLPTGLAAVTDYFVIVIDDDNVKFATTLELALAGTALEISDVGTGNQTFTSVALAGATATLQGSNNADDTDGGEWVNIGNAVNITTDANIFLSDSDVEYGFTRTAYAITAGRMTIEQVTIIK